LVHGGRGRNGISHSNIRNRILLNTVIVECEQCGETFETEADEECPYCGGPEESETEDDDEFFDDSEIE